MVIREFLRSEAKKMGGSVSAALFEVEVLAGYALGMRRTELLLHCGDELSPEEAEKISALCTRRRKGEPSAYITGEKEFMGLTFSVGEGVLIPRPDTETLVEWVLEKFQGHKPEVLDICTGSGAIAVSVACLLSGSRVSGVDISEEALSYARRNAKRHGVEVAFSKSDILKEDILGCYDLILSNPPYVTDEEMKGLSPDVRDFEPHLALSGGKDGLLFYPVIVIIAHAALRSGGYLAVEIGYRQADAVQKLFADCFVDVKVREDLAGNPRIVVGKKK